MEIHYKSSQINIIILVAVCCKSSMPLKEIQRYAMEWKYVSKFVEIQLIVLLVAACWKQLMQWFADSSHPFWPHNSNLHSFDSSSSLSLSSLSNQWSWLFMCYHCHHYPITNHGYSCVVIVITLSSQIIFEKGNVFFCRSVHLSVLSCNVSGHVDTF